MNIANTYVGMLHVLHDADNPRLDRDYRIVEGPTRKPLLGSASQWLWLVSRGLVHGGSEGKFFLTDDGLMVINAK